MNSPQNDLICAFTKFIPYNIDSWAPSDKPMHFNGDTIFHRNLYIISVILTPQLLSINKPCKNSKYSSRQPAKLKIMKHCKREKPYIQQPCKLSYIAHSDIVRSLLHCYLPETPSSSASFLGFPLILLCHLLSLHLWPHSHSLR